jgi:hypothetical protein
MRRNNVEYKMAIEVEISRYTMCLSGQFEFEDADVISLPLYRKFTVDLDD